MISAFGGKNDVENDMNDVFVDENGAFDDRNEVDSDMVVMVRS